MAKMKLVIAFTTSLGLAKKQCVVDMVPMKARYFSTSRPYGCILCYPKDEQVLHCADYEIISKELFEQLYGKVEYP